MAVITGAHNGSLKEDMDQSLHDLKTIANYLTSKIMSGDKSGIRVVTANNRGFRWAFDGTRNVSMAYTNPAGGTLAKTDAPALDNITANLQYLQWGRELTNLQMANSAAGQHVGPSADAISATKLLQRRAETEEYFFCAGTTDGKQTIAIPTTNVATTINTAGVLTCAGTADGLGGFLLGTGQYIRVYSSAYAFKHSGYITGKTSNTVLEYTPDVVTTTGILTTDFILPQGDIQAAPTNTAGLKSLRYLLNATGTAFNQANVSAMAAGAIDSTTTTFTRTSMEALYRNSKVRAGRNPDQINVTSEAQLSNYYVQFYAQNTAQVNIVGGQRPSVDVGGAGMLGEYTFWGQRIDSYPFIHPANWWMLDYGSFARMTLKQAGAMLVPAGEWVMKIAGGEYANAQQSWDDDYVEFVCQEPFRNAGFTALSFTGLPGLQVNSSYTGSNSGTQS